ncbi:hypothetical protein D3C77_510420 [compost metagenome]
MIAANDSAAVPAISKKFFKPSWSLPIALSTFVSCFVRSRRVLSERSPIAIWSVSKALERLAMSPFKLSWLIAACLYASLVPVIASVTLSSVPRNCSRTLAVVMFSRPKSLTICVSSSPAFSRLASAPESPTTEGLSSDFICVLRIVRTLRSPVPASAPLI